MWRNNNDERNNADRALKEALLRQLSQTVKEVQLFYSQTGEICSTQEGPSALIRVLEAVFLHALKRSILEAARRSVSVTDDAKPAPSFYEAVESVTHKDTRLTISKLNRINTNVGKSRAWIRLAVNEATITSYLGALHSSRKVSQLYRPAAFLRDREALDMANRLLEGLIPIHFDIPTNSSLLNTWCSEPLLMSGLWAPALRPTVQVAEDVASSLEADELYNIQTPSSSVRSLMILDEAQALRIILGTSLPEEDHLPDHLMEEVEKEMGELEIERKNILERTYSQIVENCSVTETIVPEPQPEIIEPQPITEKVTIDQTIEIPPAESEYFKEEEEEEMKEEKIETIENTEPAPIPKRLPIEEIIFRIPRTIGLKAQQFACADCKLSISFDFGPAILCNITGEQLCQNCNKLEMSVVPSRVFFNWDHTKYVIGKRAAEYLATIYTKPIFDIDALNPKLYGAVPEIREILRMRRQLNLLHLYLSTCKEETQLPVDAYIYESVHLYSLSDLLAVPGSVLKTQLEKLILIGKTHVIECWICKEKGFVCEVCKNPQVIYPFDEGTIYRCGKCKAVYHEKCLTDKETNCPKCKRRKQRKKLQNDAQ